MIILHLHPQCFFPPDNMDGKRKKVPYIYREIVTLPDTPKVQGYDFNQGVDHRALLQSFLTTGFQATHVGLAIQQINSMVRWMDHREDVCESSRSQCNRPSPQFTLLTFLQSSPTSTDQEASTAGEGSDWKCCGGSVDQPEPLELHHLPRLHFKPHQQRGQGEYPLSRTAQNGI